MTAGEMADLLSKWKEEESLLRCAGSLAEFRFEMKCRVSSLNAESFTLSSTHEDCSLTFKLDFPGTAFSYGEPVQSRQQWAGRLQKSRTRHQSSWCYCTLTLSLWILQNPEIRYC
jgi:hypothetical protein